MMVVNATANLPTLGKCGGDRPYSYLLLDCIDAITGMNHRLQRQETALQIKSRMAIYDTVVSEIIILL